MTEPTVSVIIPCFNCASPILLTLSALARQSIPSHRFEVIVVDDGSTDDSVGAIQPAVGPLPLCLVHEENRGPGAARNTGADHARGSLLVFLDADMIAAPDMLASYVTASRSYDRAILIGRQLPWPEAFASPPCHTFNYMLARDPGADVMEAPFHYVASGNFALPADLFFELGGFDERLRMTEDTDLAYRAHLASARFIYLPQAVGYHNHPKTFEQRCLQLRASAWWTAQLMAKHPGLRGRLPIYRETEPVDLAVDGWYVGFRKAARRLLAAPLPLKALMAGVRHLERYAPDSRILPFLYGKIQYSYRLAGFRSGLESGMDGCAEETGPGWSVPWSASSTTSDAGRR